MADSPAPTSSEQAAPKKSRKLLLMIIAAVVVAGAGGGGFFYFKSAKAAATPEKEEKGKKGKGEKDKEKEHEGEEEEEGAAAEEEEGDGHEGGKKGAGGKNAKKLIELSLPDDAEVKQVIELQPFIVNLADQGDPRYLRLSVSLGIGGGEGESEGKPDPLFTTRVRNAMLSILTTKTSDEILTVEGKAALRKELLRAARAASEEPKVEAIYITDFIVQL